MQLYSTVRVGCPSSLFTTWGEPFHAGNCLTSHKLECCPACTDKDFSILLGSLHRENVLSFVLTCI